MYNLRSTKKTSLKEGEAIRIQDKVKEVLLDLRILVKQDNGKEALRERRHIKKL